MSEDRVLTEEQKQLVDSLLAGQKQPDIGYIVRTVFNDQSIKLTNWQARLVKKYLSEKVIDFSKKPDFKSDIVLSDEQKAIIEKGWQDVDNELLTNMVFPNAKFSPNCSEWLAIHQYISEVIYPKVTGTNGKDYKKIEYKAPKTLHEVCFKIREYLNNDWKLESLKKDQRDCAEALKRYLSDVRLKTRMSNYLNDDDRKIFESTFIKYCYNKPDLTQEELDQFITLCIEVVIGEDILKRMETFKKLLDDITNDPDGKISMGLNEAIKNFQADYNQCSTRQRNLYKALTGERKNRIDTEIQANASVLNLVRAMKNKEQRDRMVLLAENKKERLKEEIDKFMSMDELKGLIAGLDPNTAMHG